MKPDYVAGYVHEVGEGVKRFKKGDRVLSMSALALRNDHRFGAHQRYTLSVEHFTVHVCYPFRLARDIVEDNILILP
jgi:NADPH:quinone reductase-like Zn-dependent oxidoreductase